MIYLIIVKLIISINKKISLRKLQRPIKECEKIAATHQRNGHLKNTEVLLPKKAKDKSLTIPSVIKGP